MSADQDPEAGGRAHGPYTPASSGAPQLFPLHPPEPFGQEDDPPLQHGRGEELQDLLEAEAAQQGAEVHVLQVGVQGPRQGDELGETREGVIAPKPPHADPRTLGPILPLPCYTHPRWPSARGSH